MIQTTDPKRGILYINWKKWGWAETFDFADVSMASARDHMGKLANLRAYLLPAEARIMYGRVLIPGQPRKTILAIDSPIAGNSAGLTAAPDNFLDSPYTTLLFRADGESFSRAVRHIKALPDDAVQDMTLQYAAPGGAWSSGFGGSPPIVAASATWAAGLKLFLSYWANVCTINRKGTIPLPGGGTGPGYNCAAVTALAFRDCKDVKVGRPFDTPRARQIRQ